MFARAFRSSAFAAKPLPVSLRVFWLLAFLGVALSAGWRVDSNAQTDATSQSQTDGAPVVTLEVGKPIERELAGGQSHSYQIKLEAGQYLRVVVEQQEIDVTVALSRLGQEKLFEVNDQWWPRGREVMNGVVEAAGLYRIEVQAAEKGASPGHYEIKLDALRTATETDRALIESDRLLKESRKLRARLQYDQTWPLVQQALKLKEEILGSQHPDLVRPLEELANLYSRKRDYATAESFNQRALAIVEKEYGLEHPWVARSLSELANLYAMQKEYARAEPLYQRALTILEKALGSESLNLEHYLTRFAEMYSDKGDYTKTEPLYQRLLAIKERAYGPEHPNITDTLQRLALLYSRKWNRQKEGYKGNYQKAELFYQRALAINEKAYGPEHYQVEYSLNRLADFYHNAADWWKAEPLYQRLLTISEKKYGTEHINLVPLLNSLAWVRQASGLKGAEPLYQRVLTILEKKYGSEHPDVAHALLNLASVYGISSDKDFYPDTAKRAETLYQQALAILEKKYGPEHSELIGPLRGLAKTYSDQGDTAKAAQFYQRVLAIFEKAYGPESWQLESDVTALADLYCNIKDYAKAELLYQRALAIGEKAYGPEHFRVAEYSLPKLADFYRDRGDYAKAEPLYQRMLAALEKTYGSTSVYLLNSLWLLADLYMAKEEYAKAEPLYQRALTFSQGSDTLWWSLNKLAILYREQGNYPAAVAAQQRAVEVNESLLNYYSSGSENRTLNYLSRFEEETNRAIGLHAQFAPYSQQAFKLAITTLLSRKGRGLYEVSEALMALRRRAGPQEQGLFSQLAALRSQRSALTVRGPGDRDRGAWRRQLFQIDDKHQELETELLKRAKDFREQPRPVTLEKIQEAIPQNAVLIEYLVYYPYNTKTHKNDAPRYVAYLLFKYSEPKWVELGEASIIDQAINELRLAWRDPRRLDTRQLSRKLDQLVMMPLRRLIGSDSGIKHFLVSPDGALNLVPFAALVDEHNQYLVTRYLFTYLTSGRHLLRSHMRQDSQSAALVLADPAFDGQPPTYSRSQRDIKPVYGWVQPGALNLDFANVKFRPLTGTASEAQALSRLLPDAKVLTQGQATEAALKQISGPRLLHIATHGFFLPDAKIEGKTPFPTSELAFTRSGLALAGANQLKSGDDDGLLTAWEVAGLDLWGTKLVVLSACDTGVGEIKNGDGVYGLRRAFVLAGSETQVMSLWSVSDQGTKELMVAYYKRLLRGEGRGEALRQVQLQMLKNPARRHPYYWASFIQSGEWANLDGKR